MKPSGDYFFNVSKHAPHKVQRILTIDLGENRQQLVRYDRFAKALHYPIRMWKMW